MAKRGRALGPAQARVALYVRVSTAEQATNGISLDVQERRLRALCRERGWAVAGLYADDASAKDVKRPELQRLLDDARAGKFQAVAVYKLDRLTRSVRDLYVLLEAFGERGVSLVSVTESIDATTPAGKAMVGLIGVFAEWERDIISSRIRDVMRDKRSRMEVYGSTPYGFKRTRDDRLVPVERELQVVRLVYGLRRKGKTLAAIAAALSRRGATTRKGRDWAPATLLYVLKNGLYAPYVKGAKR
ncbi:MAG TPA: recombinase family protein [Nitrospiraceae bacterium]|nr:recombinase family protein [Nitrospiraceae bacterium]